MKQITIAAISLLLSGHGLAQDKLQTTEKHISELEARKAELQSELSQLEQNIQTLRSRLSQEKLLAATARGEIVHARIKTDDVPVFDKPFVVGNVIAKLPKGTEVQVLGKPALWEIVVGDVHGYVDDVEGIDQDAVNKMNVLATTQPVEYAPATSRALTSSGSPQKAAKPSSSDSYSSPSSSPRSATQCLGTTKKGARCKRTTTDSSGYCYQHK